MSDFSRIALSGLRAANAQLAATSNNLANSETFGYKSQSVLFNALYADANGIGVAVKDLQTNFANGSVLSTGDPLHHSIVGDSFFVVQDSAGGTHYSRVGLFEFSADGFLVDHYGNRVQGLLPDQAGEMGDIYLDPGPFPPEITTEASLTANLGTDDTDDGSASMTTTYSVYDALGTEHRLQLRFDNKQVDTPAAGEATWDMTATINGEEIDLGTIGFDANGLLKTNEAPFVDGVLNIDFDTELTVPLNGLPSMEIDMNGMTGYEGDTNIRKTTCDGAAMSELHRFEVEDNGVIVMYYTDGRRKEIAQLAMATVDNINGMEVNGNYFSASSESGDVRIGAAGQAGFGNVTTGTIEGSNVDSTEELVNLITSQRFFQSNAKVISAGKTLNDALLQSV